MPHKPIFTTYNQDQQKRIEYLQESVKGLNRDIKQNPGGRSEAFAYSASSSKFTSKKGVEAWSVSYLIGKTYLAEYQGLEQAVIKQFE